MQWEELVALFHIPFEPTLRFRNNPPYLPVFFNSKFFEETKASEVDPFAQSFDDNAEFEKAEECDEGEEETDE